MFTIRDTGARLCAALFVLFFCSIAFAGSTKVEVCHIPPDNPDNYHTIKINEKALGAHLAHFDLVGPCNQFCADLCDDGNACTIDDSDDCEENGCPAITEPVDCDDGNDCTDNVCDPVSGACENPVSVTCEAPDLCTISTCDPNEGVCEETPKICSEGEQCNPENGSCESVNVSICPCFTDIMELQAAGAVEQCGENFLGRPDMAGVIYANGFRACSGTDCVEPGFVGCSYTWNGASFFEITADEDNLCRALILSNCENPNQPVAGQEQSAPQAEGTAFIDQ